MIDLFESTARTYPDRTFLTCVDAAGMETTLTYRQTRLAAAALARRLRSEGVGRGDAVVVDLANGSDYVLLVLAAAYGAFTLVALNHRLSEAEKRARLLELEHEGIPVSCTVDSAYAKQSMGHMTSIFFDDVSVLQGISGDAGRGRSIMGARQDVVEDTVHFAERQAHLFDDSARAIVMFTSGTTGKPKAVPLTWRHLVGAAKAANSSLPALGEGGWQAVLPFYHVGGLEVLVRAVVAGVSLRVYERFDAKRVLQDAASRRGPTHISVVDKMLQDMLDVAESGPDLLTAYRCILLGGGPLNPRTLERVLERDARVFASYGMTETSSQIANAPITPQLEGGLKLMNGYAARIVDPDERGFGRLAVRGPGVFEGYLNARAAFTVDGFFLTGDTAALYGDCIYVKERTGDMFVSGGENLYPAEIAAALRALPVVADAHVFGVPDETWGRRPVAVVERARAGVQAADVLQGAADRLSKMSMPQNVLVVDELPRKGIGKIDRIAAEGLYHNRLEVAKVVLHHIRLPFRTPFKTAKAMLAQRDLVLVEVQDYAGRVGLGECTSFATDWYLPETLDMDARFLQAVLAPAVKGRAFSHPRDVSAAFAELAGAHKAPMACSALEMAFWDLYGHIRNVPFWQLLNEEYDRLLRLLDPRVADMLHGLPRSATFQGAQAKVSAGAVIGIGTPAQTVEQANRAVQAGYRRVKLKISPGGQSLAAVRAVREAFPRLLITLDANQSFADHEIDELRAYDALDIGWIEEPLDMASPGFGGRRDPFARLAALQRTMATPLCIDESFADAQEAARALKQRDVRCIAVKIGKFGSIESALRFVVAAQADRREVWMGGMYDTGVSKRAHAAFETLPGVIVPGDVGSTSRYFDREVTEPAYAATRGYVLLNGEGHEAGLGCSLNTEEMARVTVQRVVV